MAKGSAFEREIAKQLSEWWTKGERDDVFWRSSQSGGRATQRKKKALSTYGSYGDVAALDPIGEPLLKCATIEIKRGYKNSGMMDIFEKMQDRRQTQFEDFIDQASRSAHDAVTPWWILIVKRDFRNALVFFPWTLFRKLNRIEPATEHLSPRIRLYRGGEKENGRIRSVCGAKLDDFFWDIPADSFRILHKSLKRGEKKI